MVAITYLGIIFFIFFTEIIRYKKDKFDFLTFFHLMFCLMYPLPAFILSAGLGGGESNNFPQFKLDVNNSQMLLAISLGYFFILAGFYSQSAQKYGGLLKIKWRDDKVILGIAIFLLLVSCLSIYIYSAQFGGVINAISKSTLIRTNTAEESGPFAFFQHFMFLSFGASYLLCSFILYKKNKLLIICGLAFAVINSIIAATITAGRGHLIIYFLTFYLTYMIVNKKIPWLSTITLLIPAILFILYGKAFFFSLSGLQDGFDTVQELFWAGVETQKDDVSTSDSLVNNFAYQLSSLQAALQTDYPLRLFQDCIYGILYFLPKRLFNLDLPDTISTLNTYYIVGSNDFEIPTGLFAFGIYSLSWPGLIIVCFTYGWIGRYLETFFNNHMTEKYWMPFFYVNTSQMWIDLYTAGDPRVFLLADFWVLSLFSLLLTVGSKIFISRHENYKNM